MGLFTKPKVVRTFELGQQLASTHFGFADSRLRGRLEQILLERARKRSPVIQPAVSEYKGKAAEAVESAFEQAASELKAVSDAFKTPEAKTRALQSLFGSAESDLHRRRFLESPEFYADLARSHSDSIGNFEYLTRFMGASARLSVSDQEFEAGLTKLLSRTGKHAVPLALKIMRPEQVASVLKMQYGAAFDEQRQEFQPFSSFVKALVSSGVHEQLTARQLNELLPSAFPAAVYAPARPLSAADLLKMSPGGRVAALKAQAAAPKVKQPRIPSPPSKRPFLTAGILRRLLDGGVNAVQLVEAAKAVAKLESVEQLSAHSANPARVKKTLEAMRAAVGDLDAQGFFASAAHKARVERSLHGFLGLALYDQPSKYRVDFYHAEQPGFWKSLIVSNDLAPPRTLEPTPGAEAAAGGAGKRRELSLTELFDKHVFGRDLKIPVGRLPPSRPKPVRAAQRAASFAASGRQAREPPAKPPKA